jgi:peptide/nickel transport system permease protein
MFWYTLKRIGLIVPTLFVVALLTFGLNQCTPGDPVMDKMPESNIKATPLETWQEFHRNYQLAAHKLGRDLPLFYFNISSQAYPDTLYRIIPLSEQENAKNLIGQYGNWPAVQNYLQALRDATKLTLSLQADIKNDLIIVCSQELQALTLIANETEIEQQLSSLQTLIGQDAILKEKLSERLSNLQTAHAQLARQAQKWKHYLPAFHWYGWKNQFHNWLARVARGDLGKSLQTSQNVSDKITSAIKWTLQLNGIAILLAYLLAIPLGVYSAIHNGSRFDRWMSIGLFFLFALPGFWTATMFSKFLTTPEWIDLFPSMGVGEVGPNTNWWEVITIRAKHFFLPVFCLTYGSLAYLTRQVRANMLIVLQSDYIRTARSKGLPPQRVIWRHAFPNALFPLITLLAGLLPSAIAGSIIIEQIFNIPGIGKLSIDSIYNNDWPIVYGLLLLTAIATTIGILLADLLYAWVDPRVKLTSTKSGANG